MKKILLASGPSLCYNEKKTRRRRLMDTLLLEVCRFVVVFFLFAVAGWCMEVTLKFIQFHRFINRGFLIGPYCPFTAGAPSL